MPETSRGNTEPEFTFPTIDNLVEGVSAEREADLKDIFKHHADLVDVVITRKGMADLYEGLLNIERFAPLVINDFFMPKIGSQISDLGTQMHTWYADNPAYDVTIDQLMDLPQSKAASNHLMAYVAFAEELIDYFEGIKPDNQIHVQIQEITAAVPANLTTHVDYEYGILANFEVSGASQYYGFRSFTEERHDDASPDVINWDSVEKVRIQSNQLIFLPTNLKVDEIDEEGNVHRYDASVPHGVRADLNDSAATNAASRVRVMIYQRGEEA